MMVDPITPLIYLYFALAFAGVAVALWVVMLVASGGRGPRLPRVGRLPRFVGPLLATLAVGLWAVGGVAYAVGGIRSEFFRAILPYAVAITAAAVCVTTGSASRFKQATEVSQVQERE
jgi:hypothetical protein